MAKDDARNASPRRSQCSRTATRSFRLQHHLRRAMMGAVIPGMVMGAWAPGTSQAGESEPVNFQRSGDMVIVKGEVKEPSGVRFNASQIGSGTVAPDAYQFDVNRLTITDNLSVSKDGTLGTGDQARVHMGGDAHELNLNSNSEINGVGSEYAGLLVDAEGGSDVILDNGSVIRGGLAQFDSNGNLKDVHPVAVRIGDGTFLGGNPVSTVQRVTFSGNGQIRANQNDAASADLPAIYLSSTPHQDPGHVYIEGGMDVLGDIKGESAKDGYRLFLTQMSLEGDIQSVYSVKADDLDSSSRVDQLTDVEKDVTLRDTDADGSMAGVVGSIERVGGNVRLEEVDAEQINSVGGDVILKGSNASAEDITQVGGKVRLEEADVSGSIRNASKLEMTGADSEVQGEIYQVGLVEVFNDALASGGADGLNELVIYDRARIEGGVRNVGEIRLSADAELAGAVRSTGLVTVENASLTNADLDGVQRVTLKADARVSSSTLRDFQQLLVQQNAGTVQFDRIENGTEVKIEPSATLNVNQDMHSVARLSMDGGQLDLSGAKAVIDQVVNLQSGSQVNGDLELASGAQAQLHQATISGDLTAQANSQTQASNLEVAGTFSLQGQTTLSGDSYQLGALDQSGQLMVDGQGTGAVNVQLTSGDALFDADSQTWVRFYEDNGDGKLRSLQFSGGALDITPGAELVVDIWSLSGDPAQAVDDLQVYDPNGDQPGDPYPYLVADADAVSGTFTLTDPASQELGPFVTAKLKHTADSVRYGVHVKDDADLSQVAEDGNAQLLAQNLESGDANTVRHRVLASVSSPQGSGKALAQSYLKGLTGQIHATGPGVAADMGRQMQRQLLARHRLTDHGVRSYELDRGLRLFYQLSDHSGEIEASHPFDYQGSSHSLGLEHQLGGGLRLGGRVQIGESEVTREDFSDQVDGEHQAIQAYLRHLEDQFGWTLFAGWMSRDLDAERAIVSQQFEPVAGKRMESAYDQSQVQLGAHVDYRFQLTPYTQVLPHLGVSYQRVSTDDFAEQGGPEALQLNVADLQQLNALAGVEVQQGVFQRGSWDVYATFRGGYQTDLLGEDLEMEAAFQEDPDHTFSVDGGRLETDQAYFGLGIEGHYDQSRYDFHLRWSRDQDQDRLNAGIGMRF